MNKSLTFKGSFVFKPIQYLVLVTFVLCFSLGFNLQAQAQVVPPLECIALDEFENTELPGNEIDLDAGGGNPGPVNVLDNGAPGVIGDIRNITYGPTEDDSRLIIEAGILSSNNDFDPAPLDLLYNAGGAGLNLDFTGVSEFNLTLRNSDLPDTSLEIILTDSENNIAETVVLNLPNNFDGDTLPVDLNFSISEFSDIGSLDLSNIFSIELRFNSLRRSSDFAISFVEICEPTTRDVPTLSEWGLIAMAGVLGIVGFMVMRRKKVTA